MSVYQGKSEITESEVLSILGNWSAGFSADDGDLTVDDIQVTNVVVNGDIILDFSANTGADESEEDGSPVSVPESFAAFVDESGNGGADESRELPTITLENVEAIAAERGLNLILGTDAAETKNGTVDGDLIFLQAGDDTTDADAGDDLVILGGGKDFAQLGDGDDYADGQDDDDIIFGDKGDDVVIGGLGHDQLHGGADSDSLWGDTLDGEGGGNDTLNGDDGDDFMFAGNGNDFLSGDQGNDQLTGGEGQDLFIFNVADGPQDDVIKDFEFESDHVEIRGVGADFDVLANLTDTAEGAMLTTALGQSILFEGHQVADFGADDFILV